MSGLRLTELMPIAKTLMEWSLALKEGEELLVLADTETDPMLVQALGAAATIVGALPTIVTILPPKIAGQDPGPIAAEAIDAADVVVCPVLPSIGHCSRVKRALNEKRIRYLSMPGITSEQMLRGAGSANYEEVLEASQRLVKILNEGQTIGIRSRLGTELTASLEGMQYWASAACARHPGELSCFPDGEACGGPAEGTARGKVVIDTTLTMFGRVQEPVVYHVEGGRVIGVEGGSQARDVKQLVSQIENADNIAEIAIGTNPAARITGNVSEDKKGLGRVHVALGNNLLYGGTTYSTLHLDGVIAEPTVIVDGKVIVDCGNVLV